MSVFHFPERVNERAARIVAAAVVILAIVALLTQWQAIPVALALGFVLRVAWGPMFSPLARAALWVAAKVAAPRPVPGAPKRFAQGIGAAVTLSVVVLQFAGVSVVANALLAVLAVFATLESVFAFCFGCWVYGRLQKAGLIAADACEVCAPERSRRAQSSGVR